MPTLVIEPSPVLKYSSNTQVAIMGSGYAPGQEVRLIITHKEGSRSDISDTLDPAPVANDDGVWATQWTVGRYSKSKIAKADVYLMMATDSDGKVLATTAFGYYNTKDPYEEWPTWAQAVIEKPAE
jgi:hypothetical protein